MMTDCQRYETLLSWITGPASDPKANEEDSELSDKDIIFLVAHRDRCDNPEHGSQDWRSQLQDLDTRLTRRLLEAFDDLTAQERGILTKDSPHYWARDACRRAGFEDIRGLQDLIGRAYVFTYNLDREDGVPEQCGQVVGTITGVGVNAYPFEGGDIETLHITSSETRLRVHLDEGHGLARVVCLAIASDMSSPRAPAQALDWHLVFMPFEIADKYRTFTGTMRILPR